LFGTLTQLCFFSNNYIVQEQFKFAIGIHMDISVSFIM